MGQDLCLSWVIFEEIGEGEHATEEYTEEQKRKDILLRAIDEASVIELDEYYATNGFSGEEEIQNLREEEKRRKHKELIEEFFKSLDYRDVSWINHKGDRIYITGGMSWGDDPTDSYTTFGEFSNISSKILEKAKIK